MMERPRGCLSWFKFSGDILGLHSLRASSARVDGLELEQRRKSAGLTGLRQILELNWLGADLVSQLCV